MQIEMTIQDWQKISHYLHMLGTHSGLSGKHEYKAAMRLGNMIADKITEQRKQWKSEHHQWDPESLEAFIFKEGKSIEEIAEIEGTSPELVKRALKRLGLLKETREEKK